MTLSTSNPEFWVFISVPLATFSAKYAVSALSFAFTGFPYISATSPILLGVCACARPSCPIHGKTYKTTTEHLAGTCPSTRPSKKQTYCHSKTQAQLYLKTPYNAFLSHSSRTSRCARPLGSLLSPVAGVIPSGNVSSGSFSVWDFPGSSSTPGNILYFLSVCLVCPVQ